jgi:5-methylcytosine-specific restriction endonuclease McrA
METTLVLDIGYQPISCTTWQTAIVWVLDKAVDVIDEYPDRYIRTVNWQVKMPSVVRLLRPVARRHAVKFSRQNVYTRDRGRCQYCGLRIGRDNWTYDHVVPRAQGGRTSWENVVVACVTCNQRKGGRTPLQARMKLATTPVRPRSLPDMDGLGLRYHPGMPAAWKDYLRSAVYWNGELDSDEDSDRH